MTKLMTIDSVLVSDFSRIGLLPTFLKLSSEMQTSSTACDCIKIPKGVATSFGPLQGKLYMATLTNEEFAKAFELGISFKGILSNDSTVLFLARRDGTELITGDSLVYRVAVSLRIPVHNYQWAFSEMIETGLLSKVEALEKYNLLANSANKHTDWKSPAFVMKEAHAAHKHIMNISTR